LRELPVSTKSLRRQMADLLTAVILTSAKLAAREETQEDQEHSLRKIPERVRKVKELVESPAYRHAQEAYVEGVISLTDLARALEPLREMLPWLVIRQKK